MMQWIQTLWIHALWIDETLLQIFFAVHLTNHTMSGRSTEIGGQWESCQTSCASERVPIVCIRLRSSSRSRSVTSIQLYRSCIRASVGHGKSEWGRLRWIWIFWDRWDRSVGGRISRPLFVSGNVLAVRTSTWRSVWFWRSEQNHSIRPPILEKVCGIWDHTGSGEKVEACQIRGILDSFFP